MESQAVFQAKTQAKIFSIELPPRDCFDELVQAKQGSSVCVSALANILRENVAELDKTAALAVSAPLVDFFQHAFKYRQVCWFQDVSFTVIIHTSENQTKR